MADALQHPSPGLMESHRKPTFMAAFRVLLDWDEARDVTQDTFLALCRQQTPVAEAKVRKWLKTVATNRAIDRKRRRNRSPVEFLEQVPDTDTQTTQVPEPIHNLIDAEARQLTHRAMTLLPERQRQVLRMRVLEGMTFVDLAGQLGITDGAAKTHFRRGLGTLARLLRTLRDNEQDEANKDG